MALVSLEQIWAASPSDLTSVLATQDRTLTGNLQYDCVVVAMIYYNANQLTEADRIWVAQPEFVTAFTIADNLSDGLFNLRQIFTAKIYTLYVHIQDMIYIIRSAAILADGPASPLIRPSEQLECKLATVLLMTGPIENFRAISFITKEAGAYYVSANVGNRPAVYEEELDTIGKLTLKEIITGTVTTQDLGYTKEAKGRIVTETLQRKYDKVYDPVAIITKFLDIDLSIIPSPQSRQWRCIYLADIWELVSLIPAPFYEDLSGRLNKRIEGAGCMDIFAPVPIEIKEDLGPLLGEIGGAGGKVALAQLVGTYAARKPTNEEIRARLLAALIPEIP